MSSTLAIRPVGSRPLADARRPTPASTHSSSPRRADAVQAWVVFALTFPVFLLSALVGRILPGRRPAGSGGGRSVIQEANASARTCGSFSLMG